MVLHVRFMLRSLREFPSVRGTHAIAGADMRKTKYVLSLALGGVLLLAGPALGQEAGSGPLDLSAPGAENVEPDAAGTAEPGLPAAPAIEGEGAGEGAIDGAPLQLDDPQAELRQEIAAIVAGLGLSPEDDGLVRAIVEASLDSRMAVLDEFGGDPKRLSFRDKLKLKGEMDDITRVTEAELSKTLSSSQIRTLQAGMSDLRDKMLASRA